MRMKAFVFGLLAAALTSCSLGDAKTAQYFVQGERLYEQHCSNCHQSDGSGLGKLYPSLVNSEWLKTKPDEVVCLIRYGSMVDSASGDRALMPGNPGLTDLELAELMTYLRKKYSDTEGIYPLSQSACLGR